MIKIVQNIVIGSVLGILLWLGGYGLFSVHVITMEPYRVAEKTDAIIVLTGGGNRVTKGLELFAAQNAPQLFITGVNPKVTKDEIIAMWNGSAPLPECCITLERQASDTPGNATETQKWITDNKIVSIRLVTSNYHMPRALLEFRRTMPAVRIYAHPVVQSDMGASSIKLWTMTFVEYNKVLARCLGIDWIKEHVRPLLVRVQRIISS